MATIPRLPLIGDPLRRIRMPPDLDAVTARGEERPAADGGLREADIEAIWNAGVALYRSGVHPALQLCVRRHGQVVLNRSIGHARGNGPSDPPDGERVLATPDTPFCVFSSSKAVTAMVVHLLHEDGVLSVDDRVADYLPEYAAQGKEATTIAHVLAHRAGVPVLSPKLLTLEALDAPGEIAAAISASKPFLKPGSALAYHAVSGGFILGEIVQRVTGRSVREVLAERVLDPLGFRWGNFGVAPEDVPEVGLSYATGPRLLPPLSLLVARVLSRSVEEVVELANDPRFLTGVVPAANVVTSADELGRFFEIMRCGGTLDGVRVMSPETVSRALTEQSRLELDLTLGFPTRFSLGLMLGAKVLSPFGLDTDGCFGHLGLINIMGWADRERGVSVGLVTSGKPLIYPEVVRFYGVMQKVASTVGKVPEAERPF